jgi:hypothetical protein
MPRRFLWGLRFGSAELCAARNAAIAGKPAPTVDRVEGYVAANAKPVGAGLPAMNDNAVHLMEHKRPTALAIALTLT